jgi:anaerobic magnesium-protoporphyrin IX monomethyl ester cyclase
MRVCLTNPPWRVAGRRGIRAGCRVPNAIGEGQHTFVPFPFTLAYAAGVLDRAGVRVAIIDAIAEDLDDEAYLDRVAAFRPDLLISEIATRSYDLDLDLARRAKERTSARVALAGSHATALPEEVLTHRHVDMVLLGEYEATLLDVVRALDEGREVAGMRGVVARGEDGKLLNGGRRELMANLDDLPHPHRATLPLHAYKVAGFPGPVLSMYASRGCPYHCTFCVWPQWFKLGNYRVRSPRSVVAEIDEVARRHGPFGSVYFDDDTFNIGKPRMLEMARELRLSRAKLPWGCNARPDLFDDEMMGRLAEAGMFTIRIGVESGDPEVLRRVKKNLDLDTVPRCIALARKHGVKVHVTFTIGLSGESWASVERTAEFARSISPDSIAFTVTTPFPGTAYYDEVVREGLLTTREWSRFDVVSDCVVRTEQMTAEEILRAEKYVARRVYASPRYILRRLRYATNGAEILALARKGADLARTILRSPA